ncbi:MAG: iron-sulfur cluster insertion protein ErpA [Pseudomonadota bacterium]
MELSITDAAVVKVRALINEEREHSPDADLALRVFVTGGGCSGFSYGFTFDDGGAEDDDAVVEEGGIRVLVDSMSYQYLEGAQVHYKEDLQGAQFVVTNPNAATTCGCGNSFSI